MNKTFMEWSEKVGGWSEIVGGPQDGGRIHAVGGELPQTVFVGPKWLGDGYSAWSRERSKRFPACYVLDGDRYRFRGF